jgi:hypothetical protein
MKLHLVCPTLALAIAVLVAPGSAHAGLVVLTDSGNVGQFQATNTGVSGGTATIVFSIPNVSAQLNTVNGSFLNPDVPTAVLGEPNITLLVTPTGAETYNVVLVPMTYEQTVGATLATSAVLRFGLQTGVAPTVLSDFFNVSGQITSLEANANPTLDFGAFAKGGSINITFTATSYTDAGSFAQFLATPGATATGNGSFSEAAVPEPASVAMVAIGIALVGGCGWFRRGRRA